jgi:hypothetical protein
MLPVMLRLYNFREELKEYDSFAAFAIGEMEERLEFVILPEKHTQKCVFFPNFPWRVS